MILIDPLTVPTSSILKHTSIDTPITFNVNGYYLLEEK
jgi:hypothetical protein